MSLTSTNGFITVSAEESTNIENVNFNEFDQATVTINFTGTIARAKTAFTVNDTTGNNVQCSFRNNIVTSES